MNSPNGDAPDAPETSPRARSEGGHPAADASTHDAFWESSFTKRPYVNAQLGYRHYRPAYRFGWEAQGRQPEAEFEDVEEELEERWENEPSELSWEEARPAVRDAWIHAADPAGTDPGNPLA
ncbi:MAG: hypothetical protein R6U63_13520 [Longimicrobiales bacterium]